MPATRLSERVIARLAQAELSEPNPHYCDDLRIARLTVAYAATGEAVGCSPHVLASYMVLGLHPNKIWPALEARRKALAGLVSLRAPKKPAQSVKLWCEKTNGARAVNSHAGTTLLRDNTISVPMAAPSIAALYANSDASSSAKTRQFSYDELTALVQFSGAPLSVKIGTLAALSARGRWPKQDGPVTYEICVSLLGMMYDGSCCRRTAQRRAKRACDLGFWRRTRGLNSWLPCVKCGTERKAAKCESCGHVGRSRDLREFRRPFTYEIDVEKFQAAPRPQEIRSIDWRTYAEYKEAAKRGEHPNVTEMPSRKPAQPTPPEPPPAKAAPVKQPAAEHAHRTTTRPEAKPAQATLTRRECAKFVADVVAKMKGHTHHVEALGGYGYDLKPTDPRYRAPMPLEEALRETCALWKRDLDAARQAIKLWGYKLEQE